MRLLFELSWMNFCWQIWWIFKDRGWLSRRSSLRPGSLLSFAHWHLALAKGSQIPTSLLAKAKSLQNHHMLWKFNDVICWIVNIRDTVIPIRTYQLYPMLGRRSRLAAVTSSCFTWLISSYGSTSVHFNGLVRSAVPAVPADTGAMLPVCFSMWPGWRQLHHYTIMFQASGCLMFLDVFIAVVNDLCAGRSFPSSRHPCLLAPTTSIPCRPASEAYSLCLMCFLLFFVWSCLPFEEHLEFRHFGPFRHFLLNKSILSLGRHRASPQLGKWAFLRVGGRMGRSEGEYQYLQASLCQACEWQVTKSEQVAEHLFWPGIGSTATKRH